MKDKEWCHHRVYGIDFSGAMNAGRKIWAAAGTIQDNMLVIEKCDRIGALTGAGVDHEECLTGLFQFVAEQRDAVFGLDFPFGLPREVIVDSSDWEHFILSFPDRYLNPQAFRACCRTWANNRELKRCTDRMQQTPWAPYNLRLYKQSFYGMGHLLAPLVGQGLVCVLPMQQPLRGRPWLVEVCPASTLKKLGPSQPYKRRDKPAQTAREQILDKLEETGDINRIPSEIRSKVIGDSEGDALDSILAALATFRALRNFHVPLPDWYEAHQVEGYVYA
jgi:hypothetical protein